MKKVVIFIGAMMMLGFSAISFAEMKIGVLDVNKALSSIPQVKKMQTDIQGQFNPRGQEVVKLQTEFRDKLEKYRQINVNLKGEALKKEQQKLFDENRKLQESEVNFQRDLVAAQNLALRPVLQQIESIVDKIAKAQKFDLIITKISTVYSNPKFEITDQVIAEMSKIAPVAAKPVVNEVKKEAAKLDKK